MPSNIFRTARGGYTLLLAVLVASILLATALSVYQFGIKETRFAILQKNSQKAVAASSQGLECAVYWDRATEDMSGLEWTIFPTSTPYAYPPSLAPGVAKCGGTDIRYAVAAGWSETVARTPTSATTQFKLDTGNGSCATVTVKKSRENDDPDLQSVTEIQSEAFSDCSGKDPRRASRRLNFTIKGDGGPIAVIGSGSPVAQCDDTVDNDGDTFTDLADPGCADAFDNDETDVVANQLPVVGTPVSSAGTSFPEGSNTTLSAAASDPDAPAGWITKVEFYRGATCLNCPGGDTTAPYQFAWNNVPAGTYSITARAYDNDGAQTTSNAVVLTVSAPPPLSTRVDMASPASYSVSTGVATPINVVLNWYRVNNSPLYATARFLKVSDGTTHYSLNDDFSLAPSSWTTAPFQEVVPILVPALAAGTYDVLTGLSGTDYGTPGDPWTDFPLEMGAGVSEVPYYPRHYKVGTLNVSGAGGSVRYLSDLVPLNDPPPNGWGPYEQDMSNGEQPAGDGNTITLDGATYAKGLGVHPYSDIDYAIPPGCQAFQAVAGVDDEVGLNSNGLIFSVETDGMPADGPHMTGSAGTRIFNVSVAGKSEITLIVEDNGDPSWDHADWADAKFTGCP